VISLQNFEENAGAAVHRAVDDTCGVAHLRG
jgi:hypothetical protein